MRLTATQVVSLFANDRDTLPKCPIKKLRMDTNSNKTFVRRGLASSMASSIAEKRNRAQILLGIKNEDACVKRFEREYGKSLIMKNDEVRCTLVEDGIIMCGRIDGYDPEEDAVVEFKSRCRGLLSVVPWTEVIQCHVYMKIYKCNSTYLVQSFGDHMNVFKIDFDEEIWEGILQKIKGNRHVKENVVITEFELQPAETDGHTCFEK